MDRDKDIHSTDEQPNTARAEEAVTPETDRENQDTTLNQTSDPGNLTHDQKGYYENPL